MSTRWTIAGIMVVILVVSLGMAALRTGSDLWAGATFLVTSGVMSLAVIGVACGRETARAWWLGFAIFGWGYLAWAFLAPYGTAGVMKPLSLEILKRNGAGGFVAQAPGLPEMFVEIAHCLVSLLFATLGGVLARVLYPPAQRAGSGGPAQDALTASLSSRSSWRVPAVGGLLGLVGFVVAAVAGSRTAPGRWAGVTVLVTWGLLGLAALGATFGRGVRRARWLGATVFGVGYLILISGHFDELSWPQAATNELLYAVKPWLPSIPTEQHPTTDAVAVANRRVLKALDQTVPMRFPEDTPLEEVVKYIVAVTRGPDGRETPIYVDPIGLQEVEKTLRSPVRLVLGGLPLRSTLPLILDQLGMMYLVKDGMIVISSSSCNVGYHEPVYDDPYLLTGQCVLAWLAAGLGFVLAPLVARSRSEPAAD